MNQVADAVERYFDDVAAAGIGFVNEAEMQHELGYWLRSRLPKGATLHFERPAGYFVKAVGLVKKEIDLVVTLADGHSRFAIELKCPRNGRHPETMFDACRDLQFLEQLVSAGFLGGLFAMHVVDPCFYESGSQDGIYAFFRARRPLAGMIAKPTGQAGGVVKLSGRYRVEWRPCGPSSRYWLQTVT